MFTIRENMKLDQDFKKFTEEFNFEKGIQRVLNSAFTIYLLF